MRTFTYDGKLSSDYGLYIKGVDVFKAAKRSVTDLTIPGMNGTLTQDNGRFENVEISYDCYIRSGAVAQLKDLENFLLSSAAYRRLEDSEDPGVYRMAKYSQETGFSQASMSHASGTVTLSFVCQPERWLTSGESFAEVTSGGTLTNPTLFAAKPVIRIYGAGTVTVGGITVAVAEGAESYVDVDSLICSCYEGATLRNGIVSLTDHTFPELPAGETGLTFSGPTKVEVKPRWWRV
jgi:phage-related protein